MPVAVNGNNNGAEATTTVLITGAAGWLGGVLAGQLLKDPETPNCRLILCDIVEPKAPAGIKPSNVVCIKADLSEPSAVAGLFTTPLGRPDVIYCLHGIMSRGAELNFDLGMKINVDSIRLMLEESRKYHQDKPIRFVFTSSIAVFGGPLPHEILPTTQPTPEGSYGCGKLISEILVNEYSRRGWISGIVIRLPTIVVRPGLPSPAASAAVSGIIRESLHGVPNVCPYGDSFDDPALDQLEVWVCSPENVIDNFIVASHVPEDKLGHHRVVNLPGFTVTIKQELEALKEVAGQSALDLVKFEKDPMNARIVASWPRAFNNDHALGLGFVLHQGGFKSIVEAFKRDVEAGRA